MIHPRYGLAAVFFLLAATSCGAPENDGRGPAVQSVPLPWAAPATDAVEVSAELRGPTRIRYMPELLATERPVAHVVIHNRSMAALEVSNLQVRLVVERDGVPFPCAHDLGTTPPSRSERVIPSGALGSFDRSIDCALPLAGTYTVAIHVSFGNTEPWRSGRAVHTMKLQVVSAKESEPHPVAGLPGIWAAVGTSRVVGTAPGDAPTKLGVSIVNASAASLVVPPMRLGLRVFRNGSSIPCEDDPVALQTPMSLGPGRTYLETIAVSCLGLRNAGRYEIVGRLLYRATDGSSSEPEIGRIHVDVSSDPTLFDRSGLVPSLDGDRRR